MVEIKKGKCEGKIYDVVSYENYPPKNKDSYHSLAVEKDGCILPERTPTDTRPGIYDAGPVFYTIPPKTEEEKKEYCSGNIIDLHSSSMKEFVEKSNKLKEMERDILTDVDSISKYFINTEDAPELAGLKEAINAKEIDLNKYAYRFGENFQNDRRALNKPTITLEKMKRFFTHLDMEAKLIIRDASSDVPNPIGRVIEVDITGGEK